MRITLLIISLFSMSLALAADPKETSSNTPANAASSAASTPASAATSAPAHKAAAVSRGVPPKVQERIQKRLSQMGTSEKIEITPTPLPNLYQVLLGHQVFYMDEDGKFLLSGTFSDVAKGVDLTEERLKGVRKSIFEDLEGSFISYGKKDAPHRAVVFTDIECGYCRRFHNNIKEINRLGIRVDYVLVPFRGEQSYRKAMNVWCSKDRNKALDLAKKGSNLPTANCLSPLEDNVEYAKLLRVQGTPAVFLGDGTSVGGYIEPVQLKQKALQNQKR